jgi:hypothetical protein
MSTIGFGRRPFSLVIRLAIGPHKMLADIHPQTSCHLRFCELPFVLNKGHGLGILFLDLFGRITRICKGFNAAYGNACSGYT